MSVERMAELRRELAEAQCQAREESDLHAIAIAEAHQRLLDSVGGDFKALGSSEDARKHALSYAALSDDAVADHLTAQRAQEYKAAMAAAELEALKDARKERELALLQRQILAAG